MTRLSCYVVVILWSGLAAADVLCGHCLNSRSPTHSRYIGTECTKLVFRFNYSTHTHEGHLLKSRAVEDWVLYNRLTDEEGGGSIVADFPNGGVVVLIGNILHKGSKANNNQVIAYGMEGVKHPKNELYAIHNTMFYDRRKPSWFVRVEKTPADFRPVLRNNLCIGSIPLTNSPKADEGGNLLFRSAADTGCYVAHYDFHLFAKSPAIDKGIDPGKMGEFSLTPEFQYVHPVKKEARPTQGRLDVGAFEFVPPEKSK